MRSTLIAMVLLGLASTPALAQWKWRDAGGQITASDRPPPKEIAEKDILARPTQPQRRTAAPVPAAPAASAAVVAGNTAKSPLEQEVEARRRASEQEAAAKNRAEEERVAQQRAENCRRARAHMAALETGQRMARVNEKGEREVLDDKARADEMRSARDVIASNCR
jgi:hypothetical protein